MAVVLNKTVNPISPVPYVVGPIAVTCAVLLAAWIAHAAHINGFWALTVGLAAAIATGVVALITEDSSRLRMGFTPALYVLCSVFVGVWGAFAVWIGPTNQTVFGWWAAGTIVLGGPTAIATWYSARYQTRWSHAAGSGTGPARPIRLRKINPWVQHLIELTGKQDWELEKRTTWPSGTGSSLHLVLPEGVTRREVANLTERLAAKGDLADGCAIEVRPAGSQKRVILDIPEVDGFAEIRYYQPRTWAKSFNEPLEIGVFRNCETAAFMLRDTTGLCVGQTGGGKTNTLQVIAAETLACNDTVLWMIDLNGSGISHPWTAANPQTPVIDWVASTAQEAETMLTAAVEVILARKHAYTQRMFDAGDDKLPIGPDLPALVIIMDEGAEALSSRASSPRVSQLLDKVVSTGRASRVVSFVSTLRATGEMLGSTNTKAQVGVRIGLKTEQPEELNHLFGWDRKVTHEDMPHVGCGLMKTKDMNSVRAFRSYRIEPAHYRTVAKAAATWRPALDQISATAAGPAYTNRRTPHTGPDQTQTLTAPSGWEDRLSDLQTRIRNGSQPITTPPAVQPAVDIFDNAPTVGGAQIIDLTSRFTHRASGQPSANVTAWIENALREATTSGQNPDGTELFNRYTQQALTDGIDPVSRATFYRRLGQTRTQSHSQSH